MMQPDRRLAAQEAGRVARASQRLRTAAAYDPIQAGLERLRTDGWLIVQTAGAAAIAWLLAAAVLHHQQAGFAPIGAVIAVEVTGCPGQSGGDLPGRNALADRWVGRCAPGRGVDR